MKTKTNSVKKTTYITKEDVKTPEELGHFVTENKWDLWQLNNLESEDISYFNTDHRSILAKAINDYKQYGTNNVEVEVFSEYANRCARLFNEKDTELRMDIEILSSREAPDWKLVTNTKFYNDAFGTNKVMTGIHIDTVMISFRKPSQIAKELSKIPLPDLMTL
tara:strand:+ start:337 stop:828 length:492 start_codon:yes stop_codon:yes gene_type:complete